MNDGKARVLYAMHIHLKHIYIYIYSTPHNIYNLNLNICVFVIPDFLIYLFIIIYCLFVSNLKSFLCQIYIRISSIKKSYSLGCIQRNIILPYVYIFHIQYQNMKLVTIIINLYIKKVTVFMNNID